jgi:hypothetical protein
MKITVLLIEGLLLLLLVLVSCEPPEILPIEKNATVNFSAPSGILEENNTEGITVKLHLSVAAVENGEVSIKQINRGDFNPFSTSPEISPTGIIKLPVRKGNTEINFRIFPIKDEGISGHQEIRFQIEALSSKLVKGSNAFYELMILDNELSGLLRAYETEGSTGYYKQEFTYNPSGNLQSVSWTNSKNQAQSGLYTYLYNEGEQLQQIHSLPENESQKLFYEDGILVKNERHGFTDVLDFETYVFDEKGALAYIAYRKKLPNGNVEMKGYREFIYLSNGNVESIAYFVFNSPVEVVLAQRISYSEYTHYDNPLPYYNGVPGLYYQPNLAGKIIVEEHGQTHTYFMEYTINSKGQVTQRTLSGPIGQELTKYTYY